MANLAGYRRESQWNADQADLADFYGFFLEKSALIRLICVLFFLLADRKLVNHSSSLREKKYALIS
jgi:hypothetical protein